MRHTHLLTILYADQQSINKVPKIWGQLNEKGNSSSPGSGSRDYSITTEGELASHHFFKLLLANN